AWGVRNLAVHGEPLLGSRAAGIILWMGNHPGATGGIMQIPRPEAFYERLRRYPEGSITREARAFSELAWEFIRQQPSRFALLALIKLERFWWTIAPDSLGEFAGARMAAFLGGTVDDTALTVGSKLFQAGTVVTALAGAVWGRRIAPASGWTGAARRLLLTSVALFWLVHIPFISEPRYRIPIAPLLHVFQAAGLVVVGDALRRALPRALPWRRHECHERRRGRTSNSARG
ncbi:MAG: hypothetical protein ACRDI2_05365, partial [Chloroflexota bacterium]